MLTGVVHKLIERSPIVRTTAAEEQAATVLDCEDSPEDEETEQPASQETSSPRETGSRTVSYLMYPNVY